MNSNLLLDEIKCFDSGASNTSKEILAQPNLWLKVFKSAQESSTEIKKFLAETRRNNNLHVILTGAGTSAFIGNVLEGAFQKNTGLITKAVATTDLVTHPDLYFQNDKDILLVSFARSGNSPESAKAVQLAKQLSHKNFNLVITCSQKSNLVNATDNTPNLTILLPPEADDKSLAMTGSFTSMLLMGMLISDIDFIDEKESDISIMAGYGEKIFKDYIKHIRQISEMDFERAIFLGSGLTRGIARESQLKLQELTDGKIICKYDSFLGFRHGPKAVINDKTIISYLFSNKSYVNKYELDLVQAVNKGRKPMYSVGVMEKKIRGIDLDLEIIMGNGNHELKEEFMSIVSVLPAQILGFFKSLQLGLKPDNPSESGMIHRVVQGVNVYPYENKRGNDNGRK